MLKSFFSRFVSGYPDSSAPKTARADSSGESVKSFRQVMEEMSGAQSRSKKEEPPRLHYCHPRERDDIPTELKFATYREGGCYIRVAYAIFHGNRCVFTKAERIGGSTIQHGEYVAKVIARRERRPLKSLRFYDLQTKTGYGRGGGDGAGGMEFDEIILAHDAVNIRHICIKNWIRTQCPDYVLALFKEYAADSRPQPASESDSKDF